MEGKWEGTEGGERERERGARGEGREGSIVKEIMRSHLIWEGTSTVPQCAPRHDSALDPKPGGNSSPIAQERPRWKHPKDGASARLDVAENDLKQGELFIDVSMASTKEEEEEEEEEKRNKEKKEKKEQKEKKWKKREQKRKREKKGEKKEKKRENMSSMASTKEREKRKREKEKRKRKRKKRKRSEKRRKKKKKKKRGEKKKEMEKRRQTKKIRSVFFRHSLFAAAHFWQRGVRAKHDHDTAVITHSLSSLRSGTSLSKRRLFKATKSVWLDSPCLGPGPSTDEKRQQSKMTSQASR